MDATAYESDDPFPSTTVGLLYNLKRGITGGPEDAEAEYDQIDTVYAIQRALEAEGIRVELMEADRDLFAKLRETPIDIAFNIAEGIGGRGREGQIPAVMELLGIPCTGSDASTLCLALDKALTKRLMSTYHVRTPRYAIVSREAPVCKKLNFPAIVKPNAEGSSKGISDLSIASTPGELKALIHRHLDLYGTPMLVEEYIEGREFTVGVLGNGKNTVVFSPMEIVYQKPTQDAFHVYSYTVKQHYQEYVSYQCPALLNAKQEKEMTDTTKKIYQALNCHDFARVDFRMTQDGAIYFIEINPLPGLAPGYSDYPMLAEMCGVSYQALVRGILTAAARRTGVDIRYEEYEDGSFCRAL